uniref:Ig-like domain-containing protein n=1 Tax=Pygocentrus nattereri TaxID=42514 RepID=A0A3B4EN08_PYGNA
MQNSEPLVISAEPGEAVTITCTFVDDSSADVRMWYKQRLEHVPLEVGSKIKDKDPVMSPHFKQTRFKIDRIANAISLRIEPVTKEDEGMYFCGLGRQNAMDFSTATFLAVTGDILIYCSQCCFYVKCLFNKSY